MNFFLSLLGKDRFFVPEEHLNSLLNLFLEKSVSFSDYTEEEGGASFSLFSIHSRKFLRDAASRGILLHRVSRSGLPALFFAYRKRWGLLIGGVLALLLLVLSSRILWDVRVYGNEVVPTGEIEEILRAGGLYPGCRLSKLHAGEIETRVLIATDRLSWISVNLMGTVAEVQVLESVPPDAEDSKRPANLVATADGQVELLTLFCGRPVVKIGQAVRAGELLVSGVADSARGVLYTRAAGAVLARTEREISVSIPFAATETEYGKERVEEVRLRLFDISAKIFKRTGNREGTCAIIEREKGLENLGLSRLPLRLFVTLSKPQNERQILRSPDEAVSLAFDALKEELSALSSDVEILQKTVQPIWTDEGLTLRCTLLCVENIAKQVEFDLLLE